MTMTAEEASVQFLALLDRVAKGEKVTIIRQGIPIVNIVPVAENNRQSIAETIRSIEAFRAKHAVDEATFREMIAEGREH